MTISKEEQARNHRRRRRQLWGVLICVLVLIGVGTVVKSVKDGIVSLFDQSGEYALYEKRLTGMVLFDPLPFDGIENMNDTSLRSAAVWGTVYDVLDTEYGLSVYTRDPETDMALLPAVEVDAYLARLLGPSFKLDHHSFEGEDELTMLYDENRKSYLIPVTSMVGSYSPKVVDIYKRAGQLYVTVGYMSLTEDVDLTTGTSLTPTKYMDYVFSNTGGNWYLTGLQPSDREVEVKATPVPTAQVEGSLTDEAIIAGVNGENQNTENPVEQPEEQPAEPAEDAPEDTPEE